MRKIRFIFEEFLRSLQKSLFKNIILMLMFSFSILMAVIMCSYYFDIDERYSIIAANIEDSSWYDLSIYYKDEEEIYNSLNTVSGCRNIMNYYEYLTESGNLIMSINTQQQVYIREDDVTRLLGEIDIEFADEVQPEPFNAYWDEEPSVLQSVKCMQVDARAFDTFGLKVSEGTGFTQQNLTIEHADDAVPIVLGNMYKGKIPLGETFDMMYAHHIYTCKVIGILDKGISVPESGDERMGMRPLDAYIVFPYGIRLINNPDETTDIDKYAFNDYVALSNGKINVSNNSDMRKQVDFFREAGNNFNLPPVRIMGTSMGIDLLRKESAGSIKIMLILTIVLLCFTFYGLFVTFYDKIKSNSRTYGIYLMNGCSVGMIIIPFIFEILLIFCPSVFLCRYILSFEDIGIGVNTDIILYASYILAGISFLIGAVFVIFSIRGVNTEHLLRQKE